MRDVVPSAAQALSVLLREAASARRSFFSWVAPAAALLVVTIAMQPAMARQGSVFRQKMEMLPPEVLAAFGVAVLDPADPVAYLAMNFTFVVLLGALFAAALGASALGREEVARTSELLYAQPVSRTTVVVGKASAGLALVLLWDAALGAAAAAAYAAVDVDVQRPAALASLFVGAALLHACLYAAAMLATARMRRPRGAFAAALGVVFGAWAVAVVSSISPELSALGRASPFTWVEAARIAREGGLPASAAALPPTTIALLAATAALYARKDLQP